MTHLHVAAVIPPATSDSPVDPSLKLFQAHEQEPSVIPDWPNDEYERIYVFRISDVDGKRDSKKA